MILASHGIIGSSIVQAFDLDAQAFFDRVTTAGGTLSTTEQNAVNTLVVRMKADGIWSKMKAIYPMVGASAAACAQNLKSSSFTGTFTSGWTFASTGVKPNGTSAYMNTGFVPSNELNTTDLVHFSYYSRTNSGKTAEYTMGSFTSPAGIIGLIIKRDNGNRAFFADFPSNTTYRGANDNNSTNGTGLFTGTQQGNDIKLFQNNSLIISNTNTTANNPITTLATYVGGLNGGAFYTDKECAFSSIGTKLTDTEASNLYTAVQAFQTTLSRQV